eukprot:scaffold1605_cov340-Prasinococcus_capsulatus_cf.AAC.9
MRGAPLPHPAGAPFFSRDAAASRASNGRERRRGAGPPLRGATRAAPRGSCKRALRALPLRLRAAGRPSHRAQKRIGVH